MKLRHLLPAFALALVAGLAQAHKASDAYVWLRVDGPEVAGRVDIALRDLDRDLDLDADADDTLTWKEVHTRWADIAALARAGLRLDADGRACTPDVADAAPTPQTAPAITEHSDGHYAVLRLRWHCPAAPRHLGVAYSLFERTDPKLVYLEMDIFWTTAAGMDPIQLLKDYPTRYKQLHLKDMKEKRVFKGDGGDPVQWMELFPLMASAGDGVLDLKGIVAEGKKVGIEEYIVEQDIVANPEVALKRSADYVSKLL